LLGNLIDNAGKWARSRVVVAVRREGHQLCFTVDDDGPGFPAAQRERVFERGVQLDEQRAGSGLGLDIVRTLADTYGGSVQALTSPLGGARLRLCLPAAD
jgi:signal transduction histidine kinase